MSNVTIHRHRSAIRRVALSRPLSLAQADGLLSFDTSVFDYGCGRGDDLRHLKALGVEASGWDPKFAPDVERVPADVVNLGYVVNVIERPEERAEVLRRAWGLARKVLVVSARLEWEARFLNGQVHGDGLVTIKGTFQKLYRQEELGAWIDQTLGGRSVATAPGVFYVFRDDADVQHFLSARVRGRLRPPSPRTSELLYEMNRPVFDELAEFVSSRGRLPRDGELGCFAALCDVAGSVQRAFAVLRRSVGSEYWQRVAEARGRDLLVYLALANFGGRPAMSQLPSDLQYDVKDFFGSYKAATAQADRLLFATGDRAAVETSCRAAIAGKLTMEALYAHVSVLSALPPVLRVYEGCGRALTGTVEDANIVKLHRQKAQVSYLAYPAFNRDPHPALSTVVIARLGHLDVTFRDFRESENPPVLHRKECFVDTEYPGRAKFERLTAQEERAGLLEDARTIGTREGWRHRLEVHGYALSGHRLTRGPGAKS